MNRKMYNQDGRSMIEMLGVLAIVGVLSVAGISGYIKAMNEYRINKVIADYTSILNSVLTLSPSMNKIAPDAAKGKRFNLAEIVEQAGWIPVNWLRQGNALYDGYFHRQINLEYRGKLGGGFIFLIYITEKSENKTESKTEDIRFCQRIVSDFAKQYYDLLRVVTMYEPGGSGSTHLGYGKDYCGGENICLISRTPDEILEFCKSCTNNKNYCRLGIAIP